MDIKLMIQSSICLTGIVVILAEVVVPGIIYICDKDNWEG